MKTIFCKLKYEDLFVNRHSCCLINRRIGFVKHWFAETECPFAETWAPLMKGVRIVFAASIQLSYRWYIENNVHQIQFMYDCWQYMTET